MIDTYATVDKLDAGIMRLAAEVGALRAENRRLRRMAKRAGRYLRIARRAHLDALQLYHAAASGVPVGRMEASKTLGVSVRRWYWARALAMLARVHDGRDWLDLDGAIVVKRLSEATARVEAEGIELLISRLPRSIAGDNLRRRQGE